jgi:hypothetical protein
MRAVAAPVALGSEASNRRGRQGEQQGDTDQQATPGFALG